jgi:hypothetical protein
MSAYPGRPEVVGGASKRLIDPMYGPAVRCKRFVDPADTVLHQCIRPLVGARCAPGHHGYQRACDLISGQASTGPFGSPVFACAGKADLHRRLILSQTLAGGLGYIIDSSSFCAVPLFVPGGRSFVPACACRRAARRGRQGWPSRGPCCPSLPCCQAALDGAENHRLPEVER